MQDRFYGDNRDLVKWGTLLALARQYEVKHILQVLYYRPNVWNRTERRYEWERIKVDEQEVEIAPEVTQHFRDVNLIRNLKSSVPIEVLNEVIDHDRGKYLESITTAIQTRNDRPGIVFLDPDTGLQPPNGGHGFTHVLNHELTRIWESLSAGDVLVFYQHETNRRGEPWINPKLNQFADAIGLHPERAKYAYAPKIARDVAFFFAKKECSS
jgi:hypothetical protein